jgi:hypothetical protein
VVRVIDRSRTSIAEAEAGPHKPDTGVERVKQEEESARDAARLVLGQCCPVVFLVEAGGHPVARCGCAGLPTATWKPLVISWPLVTASHTDAFAVR